MVVVRVPPGLYSEFPSFGMLLSEPRYGIVVWISQEIEGSQDWDRSSRRYRLDIGALFLHRDQFLRCRFVGHRDSENKLDEVRQVGNE